MHVHAYTSRRTPSTATFSTTNSSGNGPVPFRQTSQDLRRSTSSRSGTLSQPTGYVALMRRQKATVWCERAQHKDPRLLAQQRAAKIRATMEVVRGPGTGRIGTSSSASLAGSNRVTATFETRKKLKAHRRKAHPRCRSCNKRFFGQEQLESHQRGLGHSYCKECNLCFSTGWPDWQQSCDGCRDTDEGDL
jgi:hypothetical protein